MNTFFYGIANLFGHLFDLMPKLGNIPNAVIIICVLIAMVSWISMLVKYKRLGENE